MDLKPRFQEIIKANFECCESDKMIAYMIDEGIITGKALRDFMVNHEYFNRLKLQDKSCVVIREELAEIFGVSEDLIKKIIYSRK